MKIFCIGRNYVDHISELGNVQGSEMVCFMKPSTALHLNQDPWYIPHFSNDIHYECEIVLKISKNGKNIQPPQAHSFYEEISIGIDFTARDIQSNLKSKGLPWEKAKAFDHSAVVGTFYPKTQFDLNAIRFELYRNGQIAQKGDSSFMLYSFDEMICELSKYFTLQKGDLIYSGTPAGVAPIKSQDKLEGFLEGKRVFDIEIR